MDKPIPIPALLSRLPLAGVMALGLALPAAPVLAADLIVTPPPAPALTAGRDWTGPRIGVELPAGARGTLTHERSTPGTAIPTSSDYSDTGFAPGLFVGYDWLFRPRWVGGVEIGLTRPDLDFAPLPGFGPVFETGAQFSLTGRLGYLTGDRTLAYGRLGIARTSTDIPVGFFDTTSESLNAAVIGAGIETFINDRVSARIEARYLHGLDTLRTSDLNSFEMDALQVGAGISYHWNQPRSSAAPALPGTDAVWAGVHAGLSAGYAPGAIDNRISGDLHGPYGTGRAAIGLHLGYDWRLNQDWVIGAQYEFNRLDQKFHDPGQDTLLPSDTTRFATLKHSQAISLRVGRLIQPETLLYGVVGRSRMKLEAAADFYPLDGGGSQTLDGWQYGLGMETAFSRHLSMRVEGIYTDSRDDLVTTNAQNEQVRLSPSVFTGRIGFSYRF